MRLQSDEKCAHGAHEMSYVDHIVSEFGGVRPMAKKTAKPTSTVSSWLKRGSIPDAQKPEILEAARREGLTLSPEHFFPARNEEGTT